MTSNFEIW